MKITVTNAEHIAAIVWQEPSDSHEGDIAIALAIPERIKQGEPVKALAIMVHTEIEDPHIFEGDTAFIQLTNEYYSASTPITQIDIAIEWEQDEAQEVDFIMVLAKGLPTTVEMTDDPNDITEAVDYLKNAGDTGAEEKAEDPQDPQTGNEDAGIFVGD